MPKQTFSSAQRYVQAMALLKQGQLNQAAGLFSSILDQEPGNIPVAMQLARLLLQHQQFGKAADVLQRSSQHGEGDHAFWHMLGALQLKCGRTGHALLAAEKAIQLSPQAIASLNLRGNILLEQGQYDAAINSFKQAIAIDDQQVDPHNNIAWAYRALGEKELAIRHFSKAYQLDSSATEALSGVLLLKKFDNPNSPEVQAGLQGLQNPQLPLEKGVELSFALGKALEDCKDYQQAFKCFKQANTLWRQTLTYDPKAEEHFFEQLKSSYSERHQSSPTAGTTPKVTPIFVLGMPRSSTSLVEQILASHSQVTGAGELGILGNLLKEGRHFNWQTELRNEIRQAYLSGIEARAEGAPYVVDKMPQNFRYIGVILQAIPEAKIIHCQRDPRDNCLSLFKHHFPMASHPYAYNEQELVHYYGLYKGLMQHWNDVAGDKLLNLPYETLIQDFDQQLARLLDYVGLEFEASCKNFQHTKRAIRTASSDQVRRGLYQSGKGQWQNYQQELGAMFEALERVTDA